VNDGLKAALAACEAVAARNSSTLFHASRALPPARRDFFSASYAAMRVIDDVVDEEFLALPADRRDAEREAVRGRVEAWRRQTAEGASTGFLSPPLAAGFSGVVAVSDLGPGPWNGLATALFEDVDEAAMPDWAAFDRYAEGATVAPAEIFIYLLAAEVTPDGLRYRLQVPAVEYARDLAVFCYLVHILRDLAKDSAVSGRLVTIPADVLAAAGLTRETIADAVAGNRGEVLAALAAPILARADRFRERGRARIADLLPRLGLRERLALDGLITVYERLHKEFRGRYADRLDALPDLEPLARADLFG
jgi:phytoene synthase